MTELIAKISEIESRFVRGKSLADPHTLSENAVKISILLGDLSDKCIALELEFKQNRARNYHRLIGQDMSVTAAREEIRMDKDLIKQEHEVEKIRNFIKLKQQVISVIQSHLRIASQEQKGNL